MVTLFELVLNDGTAHQFDTKLFQVHKRTHGVEVLYRDEPNLKYSVNIYPWHTISRLGSYGTLVRK